MTRASILCLVLGAAHVLPSLPGQEEQGESSRFPGIEADGRIPKKQLPADLLHPERWRYFPEGRIVAGNLLERFLITSFITPIVFREEDVGTGGGLAITDIDFRNKRRREFANMVFTYTSEGQQTYSINWRRWRNMRELKGGGVIQDERSYMHANASYRKSLTSRFFGLGPGTLEAAESSFTHERSELSFRDQFTWPRAADDLMFDYGMTLEHHNLGSGRVTDAADTKAAFAGLFAAADDRDMLWVEGGVRYDTRDSLHNPYTGWQIGLHTHAAVLQTDGDVGGTTTLHGSKVFAVPPLFHDGGDRDEAHPPTDCLAFGAFISDSFGQLPFYSLPSLGGSRSLRGYINNRFTGEAAWHAAAEYRFWFVPRGFAITDKVRIERVGAALFYELGNVGAGLDGLFDAEPHDSWGTSLRFSLERTALFRFDLGFSDEGSNFSIAYGLTF